MSALRSAAVEALQQMQSLITTARTASTPERNFYSETGLGQHVRHVSDHIRAFANGLSSGVIDYDVRRRDSELERCSKQGLIELDALREILHCAIVSTQSVTVVSEVSCMEKDIRRCDSTFDRELMYLVHHTIHHAAYSALLLEKAGLKPNPMPGCAPATASYRRTGSM